MIRLSSLGLLLQKFAPTGLLLATMLCCSFGSVCGSDPLPPLQKTSTTSALDGEVQTVTYWAPASATTAPTPLFVFLHSWSSGYEQDNSKWQAEAVKRGWIYIHPDFRGANISLKACGSRFARQDVLDAIAMTRQKFNVDSSRVYLAGVSGGGHMAMLMAGHHPDQFSAVSAWVGISDLPDWYRFHLKDGQPQKYAKMILKCFGGPPGLSAELDQQYSDRSPLFHMHKVGDLPVDIFAGVNDGHTGSVPVSHSVLAFNRIAEAHGNQAVSQIELDELWSDRKLSQPKPSDQQHDEALGREIMLRRTSNASRVTIFDGGHESVTRAACDWLSNHQRDTSSTKQ